MNIELFDDRAMKPPVGYLKIYQLSEKDNPPAMKFVHASGIPSNFVAPGDYTFWSLLNICRRIFQ